MFCSCFLPYVLCLNFFGSLCYVHFSDIRFFVHVQKFAPMGDILTSIATIFGY